ncbi:DegT/DnrJ/EryC1/StrS family aminotransferase [bacterium]|nr:DegT/DnrJ/EryC1/StrS family aminotransferase [bacterium]MBU1153883.1 DegT/DnrJ/EryC1/StrS family aminotransferase [bacterium]MBU1782726.1 DegT/DnrJ/EryC1/StrS family aminotransferase [bacterium]
MSKKFITPLIDLKAEYQLIKDEIDQAIKKVVESGSFILGEEVVFLEKEIANYCQTKYAVGVASGTEALFLPLLALDIRPDDEIITTPFTFIATAEVIALLRAKPVFVDINPHTFNIDISKIEEAITPRTKAIIPVHLYGQPADMDFLLDLALKYNLTIVEDAAQAIGAEYKGKKVGSFGQVGALSFFPAKNLGGYGDGGMILTNDEEIYQKLKMLRVHGSSERYIHKYIGTNARLDEIQAAILRVKLRYLGDWIKKRRNIATKYTDLLSQARVKTPFVESFNLHVYNQYTIRAKERDRLSMRLLDEGIPTAVHYPIPLHLQEAFSYLKYKKGDFPESERAAREVLSLPIYPELKKETVEIIAHLIQRYTQDED